MEESSFDFFTPNIIFTKLGPTGHPLSMMVPKAVAHTIYADMSIQ